MKVIKFCAHGRTLTLLTRPVPYHRALLQDARNAFPQFYRSASAIDLELMNGLVIAHALVVITIHAPRDNVAPVIRSALERATNANEQFFTDIREAVRACPTLSNLSRVEQREIERLIFDVKHPSN